MDTKNWSRTILFIFIFFFSCQKGNTQIPPIDGYWNIGLQKDAIVSLKYNNQIYACTPIRIHFKLDNINNMFLNFNIGNYRIVKISGIYPEYDIFLEQRPMETGSEGKNERFYGHVKMHFIEKNKMWMELVHDSFTDENFSQKVFTGKDKIYWRAQIINEPLPETNP